VVTAAVQLESGDSVRIAFAVGHADATVDSVVPEQEKT